jgi:hypothetical protein
MEINNLPLNTIIELASKITNIEERISSIYRSLNSLTSAAIQNSEAIKSLKSDTIDQLALIYKELDGVKQEFVDDCHGRKDNERKIR